MKGIFKFTVAICLLCMSSAAFAESKIDTPIIGNMQISIQGVSEGNGNKPVSITVTRGKRDSLLPANVVAIDETTTNAEGNFTFTFKTSDANGIDGLWTDAFHTISVNVNGTEIPEKEFFYYTVNSEGQADAVKDFIDTPAQRETMLAANNVGHNTFVELGAWLNSSDDMSKIAEKLNVTFPVQITNKDFITLMNKSVAATRLSSGGSISESQLCELYSDLGISTDSEKKQFMLQSITTNAPYADIESLDAMKARAAVLYTVNKAGSTQITGLLKQNTGILGIGSDTVYAEFTGLTPTQQGRVCEELAGLLISEKVYTISALMGKLSDAIDLAENNNNVIINPPGGSSGGGGGGGFTLPAAPILGEEKKAFEDIDSVPWADEAIMWLYKNGIISGVSEGIFEPNREVKREEFVAMIVNAAKLPKLDGEMTFDDVKVGAWYYDSIKTAYLNGITNGITENTFGVGRYITRQDMAVMLYRTFESKFLNNPQNSLSFTDSDKIAGYAETAVLNLSGAGVINGIGNGEFAPAANATRAQAAVMIYKIMNL